MGGDSSKNTPAGKDPSMTHVSSSVFCCLLYPDSHPSGCCHPHSGSDLPTQSLNTPGSMLAQFPRCLSIQSNEQASKSSHHEQAMMYPAKAPMSVHRIQYDLDIGTLPGPLSHKLSPIPGEQRTLRSNSRQSFLEGKLPSEGGSLLQMAGRRCCWPKAYFACACLQAVAEAKVKQVCSAGKTASASEGLR